MGFEEVKRSPVGKYCSEFFTQKNARKKFPIVNWAPKYRLKHFVGDLVAGFTVGLTVIPQGLAYALVAELPPQYGLYSAFMGVFIYTVLGTSKDVTLGPTAIMSLLTAEFAAERAPVKHNAEIAAIYAVVLTLITGLMQFVMGLLNMGFIVQFISFPVISGFTSSAAILIAFGQVRKWLGLQGVPRDFLKQVPLTFKKIPETNLWDMTLGLICIILLVLMKMLKDFTDRRMKKVQGAKKVLFKTAWLICTARNAVIVVLCAVFAYIVVDIYGISGEGTLSLTGNITSGMPVPSVPEFSFSVEDHETNTTVTRSGFLEIAADIQEGFVVIALIGMLESIAIAKAFARRNEYKIDPSQELIAIGLANSVSSFFHSYPVTGSFSRTAINSQSGVRTPVGGIWTGALVILAIVVLTPYFYYIPQAALAAVIICAVIQMVDYEILVTLWKVKKLDLIPLFVTFFLCLFINVEIGILAGIGCSILFVLFPMARPGLQVDYVPIPPVSDANRNNKKESDEAASEAVVLRPRQGLAFPGVEYIKDKVMKHGVYEEPPRAVILYAAHFAICDYTMVQGITQLCDYFKKHKLLFVIAGCHDDIIATLQSAKIDGLVFCDTVELALSHTAGLDMNSNTKAYDNGGFTNEPGGAVMTQV